MKQKTIICTVVVLVLSMFIASTVMAECDRPNQIEVTIYNEHSGRLMTLCVAEIAIPYLGGSGFVCSGKEIF